MKVFRYTGYVAMILVVSFSLSFCSEPEPEFDLAGFDFGQEVKLRYWMPDPPHKIQKLDLEEHFVYQKLEEVTGVKVEFEHPPSPEAERQLELMQKADDLPDILEWNWLRWYPGGPDEAINDGLILSLRDLIYQHAPNLLKILSDDEDVKRKVTTATGRYYVFPSLYTDLMSRAQYGLVIRRDWLDKLEIAVPTTISDWYNMMRSMKETTFETAEGGSEYPFFIPVFGNFNTGEVWFYYLEESNAFASAWNVSHGFYRDASRKIQYGPIQPGYRDMLVELNRWYSEGLIHPIGSYSGGRGFYNLIAQSGATMSTYSFLSFLQPFKYVLAPPATLTDNAEPMGGELLPEYSGNRSAAIAATSPHAEEAAQWLDVAYSEWGNRLFNYGIAGESYELVEEQPLLIDGILRGFESARRNKAEYSSKFMKYSRILFGGGPFVAAGSLTRQLQDEYIAPNTPLDSHPWLVGARESVTDMIGFNEGRLDEYSRLIGPIRDHARMNLGAFVIGERPIEEFDEFVREIEELGVADLISLLYLAEADFLTKTME